MHICHTHTQMHMQRILATLQQFTNNCISKRIYKCKISVGTHTHTHTTITAATIYSFCYIFYSLLCDYYLFVFMCILTLRAVSEKIFCCNVYILYCVH